MGGMILGLAVATAGGALTSGTSFGTYEHFKNQDFRGGFVAGAKQGALLTFIFGTLTIGLALLGFRASNIFANLGAKMNGLGSPVYMNGLGSFQNSLGSPIYMNGLGALVASPVGALVAEPVAGCVGCGDWY